jgi:hypothetical protein
MQRSNWTGQDKVLLACYSAIYVGILVTLSWPATPLSPGKEGFYRWSEQVPIMIATFVAAWAGGWAAFSAERRTRDKAERASQVSAANKALFTIATMYNIFDNLRRFFLEQGGLRESPHRALLVDSPQPGTMQLLRFDFDALNYFLEPDGDVCSMALMELQVLEWHYQLLVNTVELRAAAVDDLHKALRALRGATTLETAQSLASVEYSKADALTNQFIRLVDEGIQLTKAMDRTMQTALQYQFPGQDFVQINFATQPPQTVPA